MQPGPRWQGGGTYPGDAKRRQPGRPVSKACACRRAVPASPSPSHAPRVRLAAPGPDPTAHLKRYRPPLPPRPLSPPFRPRGGETGGVGFPVWRRRPTISGHCTPILRASRRRKNSGQIPRAEAGGGGGRSKAAEGRYLVAVAVILLHGASDSPGGRGDGRVQLRGRALASGETPPPLLSRGGPYVAPAFVTQPHRLPGSDVTVPGGQRALPASSDLSGNKGWVLKSWELGQCGSDGVSWCQSL